MTLQYIPCAPNDNRGEQITRNFLMRSLADTDGILLGNYHLRHNNGTRECDFVLLNQNGIWVIEVKNWRGRINIDQVKWERDDKLIQHSPLISVEIKAKILASVLENAKFWNISVVGIVVLAQDSAVLNNSDDVNIREPREDKIFHLDDRLIRALNGRNLLYNEDNKPLNMPLMRKIVDRLNPRVVDPEQKRIGNLYDILYDLGPGPDEIFHAYQAVDVHTGRYVRAKKYSTLTDDRDLGKAIARFRRDMQVLVKLEDRPNIVKVYSYQPDSDSSDMYWLFLEWIKGFSLQDRLETGPDFPVQEQLHILNGILEALDCCHSNNILHRCLTPSCIYLANDGTVKLSDFDFARAPDLMATLTVKSGPLISQASRYTAPELITNARKADARSDLYALGAIWYDMVVRPESDEPIVLERLDEANLSFAAHQLMSRLLSSNPEDRPKNAKAVKRWLEQI